MPQKCVKIRVQIGKKGIKKTNGWILAPFSLEAMAPIQTGNNRVLAIDNEKPNDCRVYASVYRISFLFLSIAFAVQEALRELAEYILELTLVQEGVTWFEQRGLVTERVRARINQGTEG